MSVTNEFWVIQVLEIVIPIAIAFIASSGFWMYLTNRRDRTSLQTELLIGLAHDRIIYLGLSYIDRGWITQDEFENLEQFLFKPYLQLGGNGTAKRVMDEVKGLPMKNVLHVMRKDPKQDE